jgi:hypothetical protein
MTDIFTAERRSWLMSRAKKQPGWKAYLSDNFKVWQAGRTEAEAVGKLMISAAPITGIVILRKGE